MDGEAGTTVADRSTAAVGVANEGGEPPLAAQQDGATSGGTTTDDQTSSSADSGTRSQDQDGPDGTQITAEFPSMAMDDATTVVAAKPGPTGPTGPTSPTGPGAEAAQTTESTRTAELTAPLSDVVVDAAPASSPTATTKLTTAVVPSLTSASAGTTTFDPDARTETIKEPEPELESEPATAPEPEPKRDRKPGQDRSQSGGRGRTAAKDAAEGPSAASAATTGTPGGAAATKGTRPAPGKANSNGTGPKPAAAAVITTSTSSAAASTTAPATTSATTTDAKPAAEAVADSATRPLTKPAVEPAAKPVRSVQPELHSGHKLARRYQLAECVTRIDGFSSWRAVDEKLRRAVGIHVLPADHRRARQVLAAARSAALLGDPRFVQVLDAVEENDLVYVIHEWLPDASSLADLLAAGPLEPHEAYQMVSQVSQGMAAAHREGLAHLRLDPGAVLRTVSGQYRIRGLAVAAALRGLTSERPQRQDTEAIGALLYASLTQRWPYEEDAHGLGGLPKGVGPVAPDQVRAGVHRGLSEIAMRALVNDGATASRQDPPCTTPEELAKAVAGLPRIRPPEQAPPVYPVAAFRQPPAPPGIPAPPQIAAPAPPPALPGRTGRALKWAVSALLLVAIGLGSWQLADALKSREDQPTGHTPTGQKAAQNPTHAAASPLKIVDLKDFDPYGDGTEDPADLGNAHDGNAATYWQTQWYNGADLGNLKPGVGVVVDLGSAKHVSAVTVDFIGADTTAQLLAAPKGTTAMPGALSGFTKVTQGTGAKVTFKPAAGLTTRYLLVWLTSLPPADSGHFRGKISEINVTG
jgi:hypothetical protein